ncbi:hypothetical protein KIPB_001943 [Kipferlia bialata]|uniref:Uncharacterized protein n=1 Tax=Kipferlia bialata TaxID=797122 RepID=A0A9K3CST8_9EUKA|nr:hypothetical protein KIPB_001943 [Kipferlia bialata]|eukprot:g1943.t1
MFELVDTPRGPFNGSPTSIYHGFIVDRPSVVASIRIMDYSVDTFRRLGQGDKALPSIVLQGNCLYVLSTLRSLTATLTGTHLPECTSCHLSVNAASGF